MILPPLPPSTAWNMAHDKPLPDGGACNHPPRLPSFHSFLNSMISAEASRRPSPAGFPAFHGPEVRCSLDYSYLPPVHTPPPQPLQHEHTQNTTTAPQRPIPERPTLTDEIRPPILRHPSNVSTSRVSPQQPRMFTPQPRDHSSIEVNGFTPSSNARVVFKESLVPGKGPCYVYDDGSICPKMVNGNVVNPKWGTTKAGKPRKRLGQACNPCREKKVKCEPGASKCAQCQKTGRECVFESGSRSNHRSPRLQSTSSISYTDANSEDYQYDSPMSAGTPTPDSPRRPSAVVGAMTLENLLSPTTSVSEGSPSSNRPAKRIKISPSSNSGSTDGHGQRITDSARSPTASPFLPLEQDFSRNSDPFLVNPRLAEQYLSFFFGNPSSIPRLMLPRQPFTRWISSARNKSSQDIMLSYAILALGSSHARTAAASDDSRVFAKIAEEALSNARGHTVLQITHTRIILGLLSLFSDDVDMAAQHVASAIQSASSPQLLSEEAIKQHENQPSEYEFSTEIMAECRRRTFWAVYLMDRFVAYIGLDVYTPSFSNIRIELRLPCLDEDYNDGRVSTTPLFRSTLDLQPRPDDHEKNVGAMGFLLEIGTLVGTVLAQIHILSRTPLEGRFNETYREAFDLVESQMQSWERRYWKNSKNLPLTLPHSITATQNTWLLVPYHQVGMILYRYCPHAGMDIRTKEHHIQACYSHAKRTLEITSALFTNNSCGNRAVVPSSLHAVYVVLMALDIVTSAGPISSILDIDSKYMEIVTDGIKTLDLLAETYEFALEKRHAIKRRFKTLLTAHNATANSSTGRKAAFYLRDPVVEKMFNLDLDIVYGSPRLAYLKALGFGSGVEGENDLIELSDREDPVTS